MRVSLFVTFIFIATLISAQDLIIKAHEEYKEKNFKKSISLLKKEIKRNKLETKFFAHLKLGGIYSDLEQWEKAIENYEACLKVPKSAKDYNNLKGLGYWGLAQVHMNTGNVEKSIELLKKADIFIDDSYLTSTIAYAQMTAEKYNDALENCNIALEQDSTNAYAYSNRAFIYIQTDSLDLAEADIKLSIKFNKTNPYVFKHRGMLYLRRGDNINACLDFQRALDLGYRSYSIYKDNREVDELIEENCK